MSTIVVPTPGEGLLEEDPNAPASLAALLYQQLEATEAKQADLLQASKCLIFLTPHLYAADERSGRLPSQQATANEEAIEGTSLIARLGITLPTAFHILVSKDVMK